MPGLPSPPRLGLWTLIGAAVVLAAAAAIDVVAMRTGYTPPVSCAVLPLVQTLLLVFAFVLAVIGLIVWFFSRFQSRPALALVAGALAAAAVPVLLNGFVVPLLGLACWD